MRKSQPPGASFSNWLSRATGSESGLVINAVSKSVLLKDLEERFKSGLGFSVATINLDHVVKLRKDPAFKAAYEAQTHITADGNPIVWFSRLANDQVELVPGSELIEPVISLAAKQNVPIGFLGSTPASLDKTAEVLQQQYPDLKIVSRISPPMGFDPIGETASDAIEQLKSDGARLVFLALGAPKQERFAAFAQDQLPHTGFMSIGAGLDFISGLQNRAPKWVRRLALEWLWRLVLSPARLAGRYATCIAVLPRLLWFSTLQRFQGPGTVAGQTSSQRSL